MKRFWPLAFLSLLFGALVVRPTPTERRPAHRPTIVAAPVAPAEPPAPAPSAAAPDDSAPGRLPPGFGDPEV
jgi:hypothetical protein